MTTDIIIINVVIIMEVVLLPFPQKGQIIHEQLHKKNVFVA